MIGDLLPNFSLHEYTKNAAGVFVDYPNTIDWPRPRGMNSIYIGCYCKAILKPLSNDLELFISDPKSKGTIIVAFGTIGNWVSAPSKISEKFF